MGIFSRKPDVSDLIERVEKLERAHRSLMGEWLDWYEKGNRMLSRLVKRQEAIERKEEPVEEPRTISLPGRPGLTAAQQALQDEIISRRRRAV